MKQSASEINRIVLLNAMKEKLLRIIQEYFEGKLNLKEQIELSEQLADKQNMEAEQIIFDDWNVQLDNHPTHNHNLKPVLDHIHHLIHLKDSSRKIQLSWWNSFQHIAAILIFPILMSFSAYLYFQFGEDSGIVSYAEILCPLGVRARFQLPDGSTGYLNSGSRLKYPLKFTKRRTVELSGEAFFEVVHNNKNPFHVRTSNLDIKVLGTTFNVIANEDENTEEIILQNGKVDVSTKTGKQLTVMSPNEQLILNTKKRTFTKREVKASKYTSWKDGELIFRNENMEQVARRLSRWYNVDVVVDDLLLDYTFHATFIDEPLDEVLKLLSITTPITYKEEKRESRNDGVYQKRKINLRINRSKINQFK